MARKDTREFNELSDAIEETNDSELRSRLELEQEQANLESEW